METVNTKTEVGGPIRGALLLAALLLLTSCGTQAPGVHRLTSGWEMLISGAPSLSSGIPDAVLHPDRFEWRPMMLNEDLGGRTVLFRVPVPRLGFAHAALYLPRAPFAFRVYADNVHVLSFSDQSQFEPRSYLGWIWHLVDLPNNRVPEYLYIHAHTDLAIRFVIPHIGNRPDIVRYLIEANIGSFIVVVLCLTTAIAVLPLAFTRRDAILGSLALFLICIGWWMLNINVASQLFLPIAPWRALLETFTLYLAPAGVGIFMERSMPSGLIRPARWIGLFFFAYAVLFTLLDLAGFLPVYRSQLPFVIAVVCVAVFMIFQLIRGVLRGHTEAKILAVGVTCILAFTIHDLMLVIAFASGMVELRTLRLHWGVLGFVASMIGVAAYRVHLMQEAIRAYSVELESMVDERTRTLNEALQGLRVRDMQMREELHIASDIQKLLLPRLPLDLPGARVEGMYLPMHTVSGDYYDIASAPDEHIAILFVDVSGHGVPAALVMTMIKTIFQEVAKRLKDPSEILSHLNNRLEENLARSGTYATACTLVIGPGGVVRYANAAHRPMLLSRKGTVNLEAFDSEGVLLGAYISTPANFPAKQFTCRPGDRIFLYTDGITESPVGNDIFGDERLTDFLTEYQDSPPADICRNLVRLLDATRHPREQEDDITFLVLDFTPARS